MKKSDKEYITEAWNILIKEFSDIIDARIIKAGVHSINDVPPQLYVEMEALYNRWIIFCEKCKRKKSMLNKPKQKFFFDTLHELLQETVNAVWIYKAEAELFEFDLDMTGKEVFEKKRKIFETPRDAVIDCVSEINTLSDEI